MERRLVYAIVLMMLVAIVPSLFLKPRRPVAAPHAGDTTRAVPQARSESLPAPQASAAPPRLPPAVVRATGRPVVAETVSVGTRLASYTLTTVGAGLERTQLPQYRMFGKSQAGPVELIRPGDRMLALALVLGRDTVRLDSVGYTLARGGDTATFRGAAGGLTVTVRYAPHTGRDYLLDVTGEVDGLGGEGALLLVSLGSGFLNTEADSVLNYRSYAVVGRRTEPVSLDFSKLKPGETRTLDGPFDWVAVKSKYFIGALLSADSTQPAIGGAVATGGAHEGRTEPVAATWATMPVGPDGRFRYSVYLGPQEYRHIRRLGRELDKASPYGSIFRPIVMPVSVWITQLLLWMHEKLSLAYGWVLILFGVAVRLLLWPLNQKAMKSSVAMQAIAPLQKEIQARHKDDPQRAQQEIMKLYREHKVNPLGGCLPMLLPFPILLALFFVFGNTIEFRGAAFLWLPDLSLRDPTYVIPLVMGASMWALSKLGQLGMPPNPQAKMMTIVMPVMMTVLFLNFASGLNLYYAVSNLVSLPQQYLINKARAQELARRKSKT